MKGQPPKFDAIESTGSTDNKTLSKVGAAWTTTKDDVLSVKLDKPVTSFILVPHTPKPKAQPAPGEKPAA